MAVYGMTEKGFVPKRLADIQESINSNLLAIVDPKTGEYPFQNASDDSILQQVVGVFAEALSEAWNAAYQASVQYDPLYNSGAGQSGTVQLNAITRKPGSYSQIELSLSGQAYTVIPQGQQVTDAAKLYTFATMQEVILGEDGTGKVAAQSTTKGPFSPALGIIVKMATPISGWNNVTNTATLVVGSYEETDEELRVRQQRSTYLTGYRLIDAIYAAVYNVPGVTYARAYQNCSVSPQDERGIPFKEVAVVAEGGDSREIAEALFLRLPTGQLGYGNTTETFFDKQDIAYPISFTRPVDVPIYVNVELTIENRALFPDNYVTLVQQYILEYVQYGGEGNADGFPPGAEVLRTRLYTPINRVPGHSIKSLTIGVDPSSLGEVDIPIQWDQVSRFAADRITVMAVASE